jgi:hypothetical protein
MAMTYQYPSPNPPPAPPAKGQHGPRPLGPADVDLAWREPPLAIVLDLREKRRPLRGWLSLALAGASTLFLWFAIFAGKR